MQDYEGRCHCGAIKFSFRAPNIVDGLRCNCSICTNKGALMSSFLIPQEDLLVEIKQDALATYKFASQVAEHHFCKICGVYPFHHTLRKKGHYRVNLGCVNGINTLELPVDVIDGASL